MGAPGAGAPLPPPPPPFIFRKLHYAELHILKPLAIEPPFTKPSSYAFEMGTQGSLKYYENRDLGPHSHPP